MEQDTIHHERKTPFALTADALRPSKSTDDISVDYDKEQSWHRSQEAGRTINCYAVFNLTKDHIYRVELLEDVNGNPHGWCNCQANVVCKHIRVALALLRQERPDFGAKQLPAPATLRDAAEAALRTLRGSDREHALVDANRPNYTICDMLREALGLPAEDRSDWT